MSRLVNRPLILSVTLPSTSTPIYRSGKPISKLLHFPPVNVLVGDMGTGKTSLVLRFIKEQFFDHQEPTIGATFFTQMLLTEATVKFDLWDTAGQERYHSLAPMYYRGASAAVVVTSQTWIPLFEPKSGSRNYRIKGIQI